MKRDIGLTHFIESSPSAVSELLSMFLDQSIADYWLFWDNNLGEPNLELISGIVDSSIDVWHAGLELGTAGQPDFIDFVSPTWMLNKDPDAEIEATSWRLSFRCCLIRTEVLRQMGGPLDCFSSLDSAALEMGFRYIRNGVFMRYLPGMINVEKDNRSADISLEDQLLFIKLGFGKKWLFWTCARVFLSKRENPVNILKALVKIKKLQTEKFVKRYEHKEIKTEGKTVAGRVSVLIPTVNRYPYLRVLLNQLRNQTIKPFEIIVVDQTEINERDKNIQYEFSDLPLKWLELDQAGQCSSRNLGLQKSKGNFILFIDDDDEIPEDLIELHLKSLKSNTTNVSNGVANEDGQDKLPENFTFMRISDVFPTNNTMIKKEVLSKSGLFDLAYDRGQRADGDLGMRIYLSGERMILNPEIVVLHHHAPQGGLRTYKARVHTRAASRKSLTLRVLPSVSDIYLAKRNFSDKQVAEMLWISALGTLSIQGSLWKKILKVLISIIALPQSVWVIRKRMKKAEEMLLTYPQIPGLVE